MNFSDYKQLLQRTVSLLSADKQLQERVTLTAALAVEAEFKIRIFRQGKAADGSKIGSYSTNPMYVNPQSDALTGLPKSKFSPLGKNGKSKFKNGKRKKTRYLADGYKELRERAGRETSNVDLNLTGSSERSIKTGLQNGKVALGYTNIEREKILKGNEKRFGKDIFSLSKNEINLFNEKAAVEVATIVRELFQ